MKNIFEISYRYIVPYILRRIVEKLYNKKHSIYEISKMTRLSPSTVSRYLSRERGAMINLTDKKDIEHLIDSLVDKIETRKIGIYGIYEEVFRIVFYTLSKKYLCGFHSRIDPEIDPSKCNICPNLFRKIQ